MVGTDSIFLSYRRRQSEWPTLRLRDRLVAAFGIERIFTDIDSIELGQDFSKALEAAVGSCRVLLAVIGQDWADARDEAGRRRLENPHDWVRVEIEVALQRPDVLVIPVLIDGAKMPPIEKLPGNLAQLSLRQGVDIDAGGFTVQVDSLVVTLQKILEQPPVRPAPPSPQQAVPFMTGAFPVPGRASVQPPPVAVTDYPVLPEDLQWSGPVTGNPAVERFAVGGGSSALIEKPGLSFRAASETIKVRSGKRIAMTYEAPNGAGRSGKLRSALTA